MIITSRSIFELVGFLPKLQELDLDFTICKFTDDGAKKAFTATFPGLKSLKLYKIDLDNGISLSCAYKMIMSFPNLQALEISTSDSDGKPTTHAVCTPKIDYNALGLLQLQNVVLTYSTTSENEICLIKYLLACSPALKKIFICTRLFIMPDDKYKFARKLLKHHRASPIVDIDLN
ncbi:hypothetical protein QVD17_20879 [Tagetes erecta]|uniref:FBD domain-containing protein n=1 Tax=Tagetes erecta TaxID=13708 RepID=A0AAD8KQN2_TARER|nr:hypothetical protein QVD17_20879 [Tagetes erecta]